MVLMSGLLTFGQVSAPTVTQGKIAEGNNDFACTLFRTIYLTRVLMARLAGRLPMYLDWAARCRRSTSISRR